MKQFIVLFFVLLMACKSEVAELPDGILPPDKMKVILADIHLADALAETKAEAGLSEKMLNDKYYEQIFADRNVSQAAFYTSYKYYETHPEWMNKLYDDVLTEMSRKEEKISKQ
ncbi:MAG: DUF4296 domain-containing protein [Bacteroidetes bacterium]|nr:DUF4296 domain-containing protein [Bacteroidota bacterium]MBK8657370.1 DUF4296 domain-containing protein [Bacteroidota bacterium]